MSDNIDRLLATGKQKYLNYDVKQPYRVEGLKIAQGLSMMTSQSEYLKTGFNYPSYKVFDPQNQYDKTLVHQQALQTLEFKIDIESNCIIPNQGMPGWHFSMNFFFLCKFYEKFYA